MDQEPRHAVGEPSSTLLAVIAAAIRDALRVDRAAVSPAGGLIAAIPLTAVFGGAIAGGDPVAAATMGAGAMLVGIAWRVGGGRPPVGLLATDALLMAFSTFLGSATGLIDWLHIAVVTLWALISGLLVALGRRGAVVSTQAVIGIVVFGRFGEPVAGALGLAGLVLAGGLAMTLFVAIVRWPPPLRVQRRAVAGALRALAALARSPAEASTLPAAARLDEARAALASPALFGDPALFRLRGLTDEAARLRVEVRAIKVLLEQGLTAAEQPLAPAVGELLARSAEWLLLMADAIEGEEQAALESLVLEPTRTSPDGQLSRRMAALEGQLRAMARLAAVAGRRGSLLARRPQAGRLGVLQGLAADLRQMRANANLHAPAGRHALRLAVVVLVTEVLSRHVPLQRSYWMVVAAATALRPEFATTFTRGTERILGTCAGVALAGLISVGLHPSLGAAVPIVGLLGWVSYSVFPASFALGFAFTTTLIVFLLDAVTSATLTTASDRLLDTLVGGTIGLLAYLIWPSWSHRPARQALVDVLEAQRAYLAAAVDSLVTGRPPADISRLARRARMAFATATEVVAQSLQEPATRRIDAEQSQGVLAAERRLVGAVHVLRTSAYDGSAPLPELAALGSELDEALAAISRDLADGRGSRSEPTGDLRAGQIRLAQGLHRDGRDGLLMRQLDEIVDAVNSLTVLVGRAPV